MAVNAAAFHSLTTELAAKNVTLVAVSKTKPATDIEELYNLGQRHFGENYVQELADKQPALPPDIHWHFIGHLQSNKVKYIAPFVYLIHGVDSYKLLVEINKQAMKNNRTIQCLLQIHIAEEETKFGLNEAELDELLRNYKNDNLSNVAIKGFMGMASFTNDASQVTKEFIHLKTLFDQYKTAFNLGVLSMGMSGDYQLAVANGSNMVRIGSLLFGERNYTK